MGTFGRQCTMDCSTTGVLKRHYYDPSMTGDGYERILFQFPVIRITKFRNIYMYFLTTYIYLTLSCSQTHTTTRSRRGREDFQNRECVVKQRPTELSTTDKFRHATIYLITCKILTSSTMTHRPLVSADDETINLILGRKKTSLCVYLYPAPQICETTTLIFLKEQYSTMLVWTICDWLF